MRLGLKINLGITLCFCLLLSACSLSTKGPIKTQWYASPTKVQPNLIVFLRGMGGASNCFLNPHECFDEKGFISAVRKKLLPFDMVAPNMHFGYYKDRTLVDRLKNDIIMPAKEKGYKDIWLVGVSMGGLGSIFYLKEHSDDIKGIIILGPFLGEEDILDQISEAGGLDLWEPSTYDKDEQWQTDIWAFLKRYPHGKTGPPPIFLGLGKNDYYLKGQSILAAYLPPDKSIEIPGKHRFTTFSKLWTLFLDKGILDDISF